jgi:hypothetical protein
MIWAVLVGVPVLAILAVVGIFIYLNVRAASGGDT